MYSESFSEPHVVKHALICSTDRKHYGGPTLLREGGENYVDVSSSHIAFCGTTGSGKTSGGILPLLNNNIQAGESYIATDPKGELYEKTALQASQTHKVIKVDLRDLIGSGNDKSATWNMFLYPYKLFQSLDPDERQLASDLVADMAEGLCCVEKRAKDPFWQESAKTAFIGAALAMMLTARPEEVNIFSLYDMFVKGEERFAGSSNYLKEFTAMLPEECDAKRCLEEYVNTSAADTRSGVRVTLLEAISCFMRNEGLKGFLSTTPYDINIYELDNSEQPLAIYICIPDETPIYFRLAGVLCNQLIMRFIRLAHMKYHGKLKNRLHIVLEEFGNIAPTMPKMAFLMTAARSRNIRMEYVLQSFSQLEEIFGRTGAETIRGNTDITILYRTNSLSTLKEFSEWSGHKTILHRRGYGMAYETVPLLTPENLAALRVGQAFIIIRGRYKYVTQFPDYDELYDHDCSILTYSDEGMSQFSRSIRENKNLQYYKVFSLKDYVTKRKEEQARQRREERMKENNDITDEFAELFGNEEPTDKFEIPTFIRRNERDRMNSRKPTNPRRPDNDDIEDLIRRIDKKIAEMEEEERKEAEKTSEMQEDSSEEDNSENDKESKEKKEDKDGTDDSDEN